MVEQDLDHILKRRAVPEPRSNLAERIIEASKQSKPRTAPGRPLWEMFLDTLLLPRPAVIMVLVLLAGLLLGLNVDITSVLAGDDLTTYLYMADNTDYGDWL